MDFIQRKAFILHKVHSPTPNPSLTAFFSLFAVITIAVAIIRIVGPALNTSLVKSMRISQLRKFRPRVHVTVLKVMQVVDEYG